MKTAKEIVIEELEKELPKAQSKFTVFYWVSKAARCRPLVYRGKYKKTSDDKIDPASTDRLTTHFITIAFEGIIIYAIEILVYSVPNGLQTIFISKADTTGHYTLDSSMQKILRPKLSYAKLTVGVLRGLLRCFIDPQRLVRVCLFARSEKQYLFPLSSECETKHILSGSQLLRWWIKVLMDTFKSPHLVNDVGRARLQIPGNDSSRIRSFFPRDSSEPVTNWQVGDIFWPDHDSTQAAVNCVPRFPDDPLTRFVDFLVTDNRGKTTDQSRFWVELEAQQEFRLSVEVGVIGIEFSINPDQSIYRNDGMPDSSIPVLKARDFKSLREFVTTLDYSTLEMNQDAVKTLLRRNPSIEVQGLFAEEKTESVAKPAEANVLNATLVRRKKPKT